MEDRLDTRIDDLWAALTDPERLAQLVRRGRGRAVSGGRVPCEHHPRGRAHRKGGGVRASAAPAVDDARSRCSAWPARAHGDRGPADGRGALRPGWSGKREACPSTCFQPTARVSRFTSSIWPTTSAVASSTSTRPAGTSSSQPTKHWASASPVTQTNLRGHQAQARVTFPNTAHATPLPLDC